MACGLSSSFSAFGLVCVVKPSSAYHWVTMVQLQNVGNYRTDLILHDCEPVMIQCLRGICFQAFFFLSKSLQSSQQM